MAEKNPLEQAAAVAAKAAQAAGQALSGGQTDPQPVPGAPAAAPAPLAQPVEPRPPLPPKASQRGAAPVSPTGAAVPGLDDARQQQGAWLTTAQGARLRDTDHSLKAGARGPVLLQDHHLREKITHFDHERIPERVVHARGTGAHGTFRAYGSASELTCAAFLAKDVETDVFVRFSTVIGSRGSADTVRDTRGFATKFYTPEGTFDLVANNIPVFFIQDAIKFPDVVHAAKPHQDTEIPQAQTAHDTFWDFVSLHTEAQHHTIWAMSDRAIPRSYRMMEGFGVHTFRLVAADGRTTLVKFHWKPRLGVHSLLWEEAQLLAGKDPDFHRRDLVEAIDDGAYPQWELGVQAFPDTEDETFAGIDLLDPTKIVPEELAPVQPIGLLTLTANTRYFFGETEQVAFHVGHLVPGIDVTADPLLQGRLFSYLDTQLTRLGGPNFGQLPINRPHAPVNDMFRDGFHQHGDFAGAAPYRPNSVDGGCPFTVPGSTPSEAFLDVPQVLPSAPIERAAPVSFADHFSQARLFWLSMSPVEQDHIVRAYSFELGRCWEESVKQRQLACLARIDEVLAARVAQALGLSVPDLAEVKDVSELEDAAASGSVAGAVREPQHDPEPSPALSQVGRTWPVDARTVGIVVHPGSDLDEVTAARTALTGAGVKVLLIAPHGGPLALGSAVQAQRSFLTATSVELDAVLLAGSPPPALDSDPNLDAKAGNPPAADSAAPALAAADPRVVILLQEAYRHAKPIIGWADAGVALAAAGITPAAAGVILLDADTSGVDSSGKGAGPAAADAVLPLLAAHRVWDRFPAAV